MTKKLTPAAQLILHTLSDSAAHSVSQIQEATALSPTYILVLLKHRKRGRLAV